MQPNEIKEELENAFRKFNEVIAGFSPEQFDRIPAAGGWSGAQVADHILKSVVSAPAFLNGKVSDTDRDPGEKIGGIKAVFLDFTTKMKSPDFILPSEHPPGRDNALSSLANAGKAVTGCYETLDLAKTCLDFVLPGMGALTRLEWGWFMVYHIQRHTRQLEKILAQTAAS